MNLIFDIGNVLIDFKPEMFLHSLFGEPAVERKINEIIFMSDEWVRLDEGNMTPQEACADFCEREPRYREQIIRAMAHLPDMLTPISETIQLLPKVKAAGHGLYYLSNYHAELSRYIQNEYSFFDSFDGGVFSCDVHIVKPSVEIYRYFLKKYQLQASECVFFDDMVQNVTAAKKAGIKGVLFTGIAAVSDYI